jgi:hypothetical protein
MNEKNKIKERIKYLEKEVKIARDYVNSELCEHLVMAYGNLFLLEEELDNLRLELEKGT